MGTTFYNKLRSSYVHLFLLFLIAFSLRLYQFRRGETFFSSDEVFLFEYAVKPVYAFFHLSLETIATELFRFFNFGWGWGNLFFGTLFFFFYKLFNIPFTEFTINLPYIFVGTGAVFMAYLLGKELHNKIYGFIVAFLLAILPSHIAFSRSIGLNSISGLFCFLLTLYWFLRYFKTKRIRLLYLGYISLGFYLVTENQALGIFPVLLFTSYVYAPPQPFFSRLLAAFQQLYSGIGISFSLVFLFPTILGAVYLTSIGRFTSSFLNIFHSKPIIISFYWEYVLSSFVTDIGLLFTALLLLGLLSYFFFLVFWKATRESIIIFTWFFIYTTPWLFLVLPTSYELRLYNTYTLTALVFLTGYLLTWIIQRILSIRSQMGSYILTSIFIIISAAFIFQTLLITSSTVYRTDFFGVHMPPAVFGSVQQNSGIKTIAYYVREQTPKDSIIFVDVESFVGQYYFNRTIIGDLDLTDEQIYNQLLHTITENTTQDNKYAFDYAFIYHKHFALLAPLLETSGYTIKAIAVDDDGKTIGRLYEADAEDPLPVVLRIQMYDNLFNKEYGTLESIYIDYG